MKKVLFLVALLIGCGSSVPKPNPLPNCPSGYMYVYSPNSGWNGTADGYCLKQ